MKCILFQKILLFFVQKGDFKKNNDFDDIEMYLNQKLSFNIKIKTKIVNYFKKNVKEKNNSNESENENKWIPKNEASNDKNESSGSNSKSNSENKNIKNKESKNNTNNKNKEDD